MEPTPPNPQPQTVSRLERLVAGLEAQVLALQRQVGQEQASAKVLRQEAKRLLTHARYLHQCGAIVRDDEPYFQSLAQALGEMFP